MGAGHRDSPAEAAFEVEAATVEALQERIGILTAFTGGIVFEFDREGRYLRVFTNEPELLVRPADALLGRTIDEVLGAATGARFHETIRHVFDTGEQSAFEYSLDVQAGRRVFSAMVIAHDAPGGRARTVTLLVRDVTSAKALEAKLVQAERLAAIGLLAASVGHEIRQPLSYVITSLDALEQQLEAARMPDHAHASFDKIRAAAGRIAEIAASLDLLAADRRRTTAPVDVRRPLQAAIDQCASELSGSRVESRLTDVPLVRADEGELCQVFVNLLLNAAQSLEGRLAEGVVRISTTVVGDHVRVSIGDNGSGIAPEHLAHIFDPFFTTREQRGGTGLGLFITRGIVEAHGGSLEVKSESGRGTTVDVLLPLARASELPREPVTGTRARPSEVVRVTEPRTTAPVTRRRLSVLLVDDEPRFLESLRLALEDAHAVETHRRAADALAILEADPKRYDVVVCDLAMPEIDGAMFYERMKALGIEDRFVLMTGGAFTTSAEEFVASRTCPSIGKPFLLERLLALLDDVTRDQTAS